MADSDILRGAIQAAAGQTLGLSQDEVLDLKRRQVRGRIDEKRAARAERAGNQQIAEDFLAEDTRRFESIGSFEEQERYPDPFGIPVSGADPDSGFGEISERGVTPAERQRGGYVLVDRGRGKERVWREGGQLVSEPKYAKNKLPDFSSPFVETPTAPQGAGMGGPNGLATQLADMVARGEVDPEALVPGSQTKRIKDLIADMAMEANPKLRAKADKEIGKQTAQRDAARFTPAARAISDAAAGREAIGYIANNDNGLSDIQKIQSLGLASKKMNKSGVNFENFSVTPGVDPSTFDDATAYVQYLLEPGVQGPNGPTIGYADNQDRFIAETNMSGTDNIANSPVSRTATWMEGNLPDFGREQGTTFGPDRINPGNELGMLNERLGKFGLATGIRGIDDLEQVVRSYVVDAAFSGRGIFKRDPENPQKQIFVRDPGLDEVLGELDYTPGEKRRLAASLQSVEAARLSPVNGLQKELFAAGIPSESQATRQVRTIVPAAGSVYDGVTGNESGYDYYETQYRSEPRVTTGFEKDAQLSRIKDERVGRDNKKTGEKRKSVKSLLKQLDGSPEQVFKDRDPSTVYATTPDGQQVLLPDAQQDLNDARIALTDAQKPFQAGIEGEPVDRARFASKGVYRMTPEQRSERFGPKGAEVANEVIRRAVEDKQLRTAESKQPDPIAAEFRTRDAQFARDGQARKDQDSYQEKLRLRGNNPLQPITSRINNQQETSTTPLTATIREAMNVTPSDGFSMPSRNPVEAQKAAPNQSPLSGISYNENAPDPWVTPPGTGGGFTQNNEKRIPASMLNALAELNSGPKQGPVPGSARKQFADKANFIAKSPRMRTARRVGYGGAGLAGVGGLASLIGGESERRQEEQY